MIRIAPLLMLLTTPATAWEFTSDPICTLTQPTEQGAVTVTHDLATGEYAIILTRSFDTWEASDSFSMEFIGQRPIQIATSRHQITNAGRTLTVKDTGFGNVLDGLQFIALAQASVGGASMTISLTDAAEPVAAFRNCKTAKPSV